MFEGENTYSNIFKLKELTFSEYRVPTSISVPKSTYL